MAEIKLGNLNLTRTQVRELGPRDRSLLWSVLVCPGLSSFVLVCPGLSWSGLVWSGLISPRFPQYFP